MPGGQPSNDVAIYSPASNSFYEEIAARGGPRGGGQELQMTLLARALAERGLRVAHIVWPLRAPPIPRGGPEPALVERPAYAGNRARIGKLLEARYLWRSMRDADAAAYVFRGAGPQLMIGAAFCRRHRRRLVFSSANDLEFDLERPDRSRSHLKMYRAALRRADLIVVQTERQAGLAHAAGLRDPVPIPSFVEPAAPSSRDPEAFLWIGRLVAYKQPLEYLRLVASVPEAHFRMVSFEMPETEADVSVASEFERRAAALENLELLAQLPRVRALEQIERAVAVVSTSRAEGMPNTFLEAWTRGVPVLTLSFDPDGLIETERLGIAAGGSEEDFARGAAALWSDRDLRSELGSNARRYVLERHSPESVGASWQECLRELIG